MHISRYLKVFKVKKLQLSPLDLFTVIEGINCDLKPYALQPWGFPISQVTK